MRVRDRHRTTVRAIPSPGWTPPAYIDQSNHKRGVRTSLLKPERGPSQCRTTRVHQPEVKPDFVFGCYLPSGYGSAWALAQQGDAHGADPDDRGDVESAFEETEVSCQLRTSGCSKQQHDRS